MPANGADGGIAAQPAPAGTPPTSSPSSPPAGARLDDPGVRPRAFGRWPTSVRMRLLLLLALVAVPIVLLTVRNAIERRDDDVVDARRDASIALLAVLSRHQVVLHGTQDLLTTLSAVPLTWSGEMPRCQAFLGEVAGRFSERITSISVIGGDGRVICSSLPFVPGNDVSGQDFFREARNAHDFSVSYFATGSVTREGIFIAGQPVVADGALRGVIIAPIRIAYFIAVGSRSPLPAGSHFFVSDSRGRIVSPTASEAEIAQHREHVLSLRPVRGGPVLSEVAADVGFVYAASALDDDLRATIAVPEAAMLHLAQVDFLRRIGETALLVLLSIVAVSWGAHSLVLQPLRRLARAAASYRGAGTDFAVEGDMSRAPREIRELQRRFEEMTAVALERETRLQNLVEQRELLVREMHHRVKNNLQIVSSLLSLQSQRIRSPAARAEFAAARDRVRALSLLHRHLYGQGDLETMDFRAFARDLVEHLHGLLDDDEKARVAVLVDMAPVRLVPDKAVPLGLVITEAVSNAFKYAFADGRGGTVIIQFEIDGDTGVLTVADDGVGVDAAAAEPADPNDGGGLGRVLMAGFAQQIGGTLTIENAGGTKVTLRFPLAAETPG